MAHVGLNLIFLTVMSNPSDFTGNACMSKVH